MIDSNQSKLRVLTLNTWGIPLLSSLRSKRMTAIANALSELDCDIIALQEVWLSKDYEMIKSSLNECGLRFSHYFHSGIIGSGCCMFSRHKILHAFQLQFSLNGFPHKLQHGDFYAGKMVGLCEIELANGKSLKCYVSHLHANYSGLNWTPPPFHADSYCLHRIAQAYELVQFIRNTSSSHNPIILLGDLNCDPESFDYKLITKLLDLKCAFATRKLTGCPELKCFTCQTELNCFRTPNAEPEQIDHILYRSGIDCELESLECFPFLGQMPDKTEVYKGRRCCYSDHEAILAVLSLKQTAKNEKINKRRRPSNEQRELLLELENLLGSALEQKRLAQFYRLFVGLFLGILGIAWFGQGLFGFILSFLFGLVSSMLLWQATLGQQYERTAIRRFLVCIEHELS